MGDLISRQDVPDTNVGDMISRQDALQVASEECLEFRGMYGRIEDRINQLPSAKSVKSYTKADYIMALHKEYGCTLTMAEEAHNKALEHLRSKARMKG